MVKWDNLSTHRKKQWAHRAHHKDTKYIPILGDMSGCSCFATTFSHSCQSFFSPIQHLKHQIIDLPLVCNSLPYRTNPSVFEPELNKSCFSCLLIRHPGIPIVIIALLHWEAHPTLQPQVKVLVAFEIMEEPKNDNTTCLFSSWESFR